MLKGIIETVARGLRAAGVNVTRGMGLNNEKLCCPLEGPPTLHVQLARLEANDLFIWIGEWMTEPYLPLRTILATRGVKRIHYQTEPQPRPCALADDARYVRDFDEVWDYSWFNIDGCNRSRVLARFAPIHPTLRRWRYVPVASLTSLGSAATGSVPTGSTGPRPCALFLGNPDETGPIPRSSSSSSANSSRRSHSDISSRNDTPLSSITRSALPLLGRRRCYAELSARLGRLQLWHTYRAWSDEAMAATLAVCPVALNLHRTCGNPHSPLQSVRLAALLDGNRFVLSERSHPKDEAEFAGIVEFVDNTSELATVFARLAGLGRMGLYNRALNASQRFRQRFQPAAIFERAGLNTWIAR